MVKLKAETKYNLYLSLQTIENYLLSLRIDFVTDIPMVILNFVDFDLPATHHSFLKCTWR